MLQLPVDVQRERIAGRLNTDTRPPVLPVRRLGAHASSDAAIIQNPYPGWRCRETPAIGTAPKYRLSKLRGSWTWTGATAHRAGRDTILPAPGCVAGPRHPGRAVAVFAIGRVVSRPIPPRIRPPRHQLIAAIGFTQRLPYRPDTTRRRYSPMESLPRRAACRAGTRRDLAASGGQPWWLSHPKSSRHGRPGVHAQDRHLPRPANPPVDGADDGADRCSCWSPHPLD